MTLNISIVAVESKINEFIPKKNSQASENNNILIWTFFLIAKWYWQRPKYRGKERKIEEISTSKFNLKYKTKLVTPFFPLYEFGGGQKKSASARIGQPKRKQSTDLHSFKSFTILNTAVYYQEILGKLNHHVTTKNIHLSHHSFSTENVWTFLSCSFLLPVLITISVLK